MMPAQPKVARSVLGKLNHPPAQLLLKAGKLLTKRLCRVRVLKVKAKSMPPLLHQFTHFGCGVSTLSEKNMSRSAVCIEDVKNRLQFVEITKPLHARQEVI